MAVVRIASVQVNPTTVGDFRRNVSQIVAEIGRARDLGADVVTFPELAVCGYPPEDLLLRPGFLHDSVAAIQQVAEATERITAVVGFADAPDDGNVYNAAAVTSDTHLASVYHKTELPNYGVFDEKRYFVPGQNQLVFDIRHVRVAITICEDIWIEGNSIERRCSGGIRAGDGPRRGANG